MGLIFLRGNRSSKISRKNQPIKEPPPPTRDQIIREKREEGTTLMSIGEEYGISHARVAQICKK